MLVQRKKKKMVKNFFIGNNNIESFIRKNSDKDEDINNKSDDNRPQSFQQDNTNIKQNRENSFEEHNIHNPQFNDSIDPMKSINY